MNTLIVGDDRIFQNFPPPIQLKHGDVLRYQCESVYSGSKSESIYQTKAGIQYAIPSECFKKRQVIPPHRYYALLRKAWGIVNRLPQKDRHKHYSVLKSRMNRVRPLI